MVTTLKLPLLGAALVSESLLPQCPLSLKQLSSHLLAFHSHFHSACIQVYGYTNLLYLKVIR